MNALKRIVLDALVTSGISAIARQATRGLPRILMYHAFSDNFDSTRGATTKNDFRAHLKYIKNKFVPWKLSDLVRHHTETGSYPSGAVVITVDDGYESFYSIALPLLQEFKIPATVYVVAEATENNLWLWTDILEYIYTNTPLLCSKDKASEHSKSLAELKTMTPTERDTALRDRIAQYAVEIPPTPPQPYNLMSWTQLKRAIGTGLVEVGAHSCTHPIFAYLDSQQSHYEIVGAKELIESRLGINITSFCYPNGQPSDYTTEQKELIMRSGFTCCPVTDYGLIEPCSDQYALPRIASESNYKRFKFAVDGFYHIYLKHIKTTPKS